MNTQESFQQAIRAIEEIRYYLHSLGNSFMQTGNENMANSLWRCANRLDEAGSQASVAMNETIGQMFKAAQESSRNMLEAALAGGELARRETGK